MRCATRATAGSSRSSCDGQLDGQLGGQLQPWGGVTQVWAFGSPRSTHGVDTTDTFDRGVASLRAHAAYLDGLGWKDFDATEFLAGMAQATGVRLGVRFGAAFEVFPMGWGE